MHPISAESFARRRKVLSQKTLGAHTLLVGHSLLGRNYPANPLPFRQDSTFLFFTGCQEPGSAAIIDPDGLTTLYLPAPSPDDALWHGETDAWEVAIESTGVDRVRGLSEISDDLEQLGHEGAILSSPRITQADAMARRALWLQLAKQIDGIEAHPNATVENAVIEMRLRRDTEELDQMRAAARVTAEAFSAAWAATRAGSTDRAIQAAIEAVFIANGCPSAYPPIVTVRGEVLHGRATGNVLQPGQLLLADAGAEHPYGLATDVTRTWPVSGRFDGLQRAVYDAVFMAQKQAIDACRVGVRYRDVHLSACLSLARSLVELNLLHGEVDGLVERGAHAVFFPHGVGHLIGLDVHDLELFGDRAGYAVGRERSAQFGLSYLRLDRDLEPGMTVTIEPGVYFVPAILQDSDIRGRFSRAVNWELAEQLASRGFGGIRIEDDVHVTDNDPEVITALIPSDPSAIEDILAGICA